ncbi:Grx4 family monothiol glutaredoxin [Dichotomicrobium thermohalophilum]|uniref:Glutaredoxin n=1 Tax=Dichotomicrobium thermohalophilum TaxID=933063 RepID=A0A397Q2E3_9HYPH|nr:Grx4 family monothiol glutaredoxin [Dichotomicrobium thermohalophilum]RIA55103.1 monothiol glutaredoxin [Dichotomicrobium thermohalophilum]
MDQQNVHDWIKDQVQSNDVVLFMKGNRHFPQCGFSAQVVRMLDYLGVDYKDINVLDDNDVREGIKTYTNWPTIPQLYVKGEFVGGCDILTEMFQEGELQQHLEQKDIAFEKRSAPA